MTKELKIKENCLESPPEYDLILSVQLFDFRSLIFGSIRKTNTLSNELTKARGFQEQFIHSY